MGPPISVGVGFCLLFIVGGSFAGILPLKDEPECGKGLPVGKTFVYKYAGVSKIENEDVNQEVHFSADVVVSVPRECVLGVQLRNVESPHQKFVHSLQNHVIEVRMDNGEIKELKHNPAEPVWALNVKRAIVSMLQTPSTALESSVDSDEKDVLGICKTNYEPVEASGDEVVIRKTKNLLSCEARTLSTKSIFFTAYDAPQSDIRTAPVASGNYICRNIINKSTGVLKEATCQQTEKLYLSEQSSATPGVISVVTSEASLELVREEDGAQNVRSATYRRSCLVFDHEFERDHLRESLVSAIDRYCDSMQPDVRPESGKLFGDLIKSMRSAPYAKIAEVYESIENKPCDTKKLKTAFLDVLGMAGSTGSIEMIAKFIQNGEHKEHHQKWLKSLAYISNPTQDMVQAMIPVVQSAGPESAKSILLPVSAMAHTFCKTQYEECDQTAAIKQLLSVLVKKLDNDCSGDRAIIVATLKALGNLGVTGGYHNKIMQCMNDKPTDIRTYTLRAFRKVCDSEVTQQMVNLYADQSEDVEVRIGAYLNAMRCADFDTVAKIVSVYETEKVVQVGSFVYSHLRVIHESECPLKAELKRLISTFPVSAKFSQDPSKFSQNYEYSKFYDSVNIGGVADASIVFSPKSFLPRSASLNLSLDLFSQNVNLLEIGGRVEGLEKIVEQLVGRNSARPSRRASRDSTDVERFDNDFKNEIATDEKMSFYVNIYGNEIDFVEYNSVKELTSQMLMSVVKVYSLHPSALLNNIVLEGQIDIAKNALLVDKSVSTATITGLGLVLEMRAVTNTVLKASAPASNEAGFMKASLEPSAVVQVDGSLTLSAGVFRHGARFASTIHTSSVVDVEITRREGEFKFRFNTPREKLEILNAKSEVFAVQGDYETPITAKAVRNLDGCTMQLPEIFGMSACISGTVPKPWYMAGRGFVKPFNFALTLQKTDTNMEGVEFSYLYSRNSFSFVFDTPGSTVDRRSEFHYKSTDSSVTVWGQCPRKTFHFGISTESEDFVVFRIVDKETEKADEYAIRIRYGLGAIFISNELGLEFSCPHLREPLTLAIKNVNQKTEILSNYPQSNPLNITVNVGQTSLNATISVGDLDASSRLSMHEEKDRRTAKWHGVMHTTYKIGDKKTQKFHYELKLREDYNDNVVHSSALSTWTSTCHPQYNNKLAYDRQIEDESRKHKIQAWWGEKFTDDDKTIRIATESKQKGSFGYGRMTTLQLRGQVYSPALGLDYDVNFDNKIDLEKTPRITSELFVASDKKTLVKFDYTFDRHSKKTTVRASLIAPYTSLRLSDDSEEVSKGKYKGTCELGWGLEGKKLSIDYTTELMANGNHDVKLNIRAPNMKPIQHRQLVRIARDVELKTETLIDGKEYLVFEIKRQDKDVAFNFVGQRLQVKYSRSVKDKALDVKLDVHSKVYYTRPISLTIHKDSPGKKSHELAVNFLWDAVANPSKKLSIDMKTDREDGVKTHAKVTVSQFVDFEYKGVYVKGFIKGPNRAEFRLSGANIEARELIVGHVHSTPEGEGYLKYTKGGKVWIDGKLGHKFTSEKRHYYLSSTGMINRKLDITRDLVARTLKIDLDRDGKVYSLLVDRKTDYSKGIIDCKITMNLPYEDYKTQELTAKGTLVDGKLDLTVHYLSSRQKNYHFVVKGTRPGPMVLDVEISIKSDYEKLKEGKAHLKYNLADAAERMFMLDVERETNKIFDLEVHMKKDDASREMNFKLASEFTPAYDGSMKMKGTSSKFNSNMLINKNGAVWYTADVDFENTGDKMLYSGKYHGGILGGDTEVAFEKNTLPGNNHRTYKLNVKRNGKELRADAETQRADGFKITSVNACRTPLETDCVSVTVKRNVANFNVFRNNALNVKIHRKPDVTLEIDSQMHIPQDVHKAHVRLVGNVNEFKLGFDYNCDHSTEQVSEQTLRGYVVDREMLATRRRENTDKFVDIKYSAALDAKSEEKLEASYRRDYNDKGFNSVLKLSHPKMRTPIVVKSEISRGKDANSLYRLESEVEFFRPEDTIFLHYERRLNDEIARNKSIHIHVHKKDKSDFDLHVTMYRSIDLQKPVFAGYYWSYVTAKKETRVGTMKAFLGEDLKGSIEFTSPYQDNFKITGEAKVVNDDGDKEAEIVHLKNDVETKGKISYNLAKLYMKAVVLNSDGTTGRELEVDGGRKEKGRYKLVLSSFPEGKRTTDLGIEHSRSSETSFHSRVYAPPEYLKRVAERAKEIAATRAGKYPIEDMKEELKTRTDALAFRLRKTFEDVPEYLLTKISQIFVEIQGSLTRLINNTTVGQRLKARFEANRERIGQLMQKFLEMVRKCCPALAERLEASMAEFLPKRARRSVKEESINFVAYVLVRIEMFEEWLINTPPVKLMVRAYNRIADVVTTVSNGVHVRIEALRRKFLAVPDVKQIAETWAELYDSSTAGHLVPKEALFKYVIAPRLDRYTPRVPVLEVDRKAGRFVADVDVPVDASKLVQYWAYGTEEPQPERQHGYETYDLCSTMEMVRKSLSKAYDGQATVIDGKHFITFDGKHFSVKGSCSYLLARDFVNGTFSIVLNNNGDVPSYVLQFGDTRIEVRKHSSLEITLNGKPISAPMMMDNISVLRMLDMVRISNGDVKFVLNLSNGVATIDTRIWYFGKTAGLLGNYNREPSDDFKTPTGAVVTNEDDFLDSWETESCDADLVLFRDRTEEVEAVEFCDKIFKNELSTLSLGFMVRSADEYHDLCLRAAQAVENKIHSSCQVAYAYFKDIERYAKIPSYLGARLPDECLTCELPLAPNAAIGNRTYGHFETGDTADVIFAVQDNECNANFSGNIHALVKSIDKELAAKNVRHNRYGLVGFGGEGELHDAHLRSAKGRLMFPARDLHLALEGMAMTSNEPGDIFLAVHAAMTQYRFRPTATKVIVLFSCHKCSVMDKTAPDYIDLRTALLERGIFLHLVSRDSVKSRGHVSKRSPQILGLDTDVAYTARDVNQNPLMGSLDLKSQIRAPKNVCVLMALESSGSWFTAPSQKNEQRAWKIVFSKRIAENVSQQEQCLVCDCQAAETYSTRTVCKPCKPRRLAYVDFEEDED
ncbi:apolipophorins [Galendromus occidentalis]|uniref:Apolipophorins n=1 Tax=Galendromus occidentalis TaxID=34638 RepID=A0AAJ7P9G0_9ACAR|nr:apolipophorins [Galendromus occidentalis]